jgi:hypothetical protein
MDEGKARQVAREIASQFMLEGGIYCAELTEAITSALLSIAADEREECAKVADRRVLFGLSGRVDMWAASIAADIRNRRPQARSHPVNEIKEQTTVPGLKSGHQIITPTCRHNRGTTPAFLEAAERLQKLYDLYARAPDNRDVTWHLVLVREEPDATAMTEGGKGQ